MTTTETSNEIVELQKTLMRQQEDYSLIRTKILEKRKIICDVRAEISPLEIACHEAECNIRKTRIQLKMKENEYWNARNGL